MYNKSRPKSIREREEEAAGQKAACVFACKEGVFHMKIPLRDIAGLTIAFGVVMVGGMLRLMAYLPQTL